MDGEGLVIKLKTPGSLNKLPFSRKNVVFIYPRLCRTHIIYRYSYIVLSLCLTMTENINQLGSKLERAPSCIRQHTGPPQPRITAPTDARPLYALYINIITTLIYHIPRHHHNRNIDLPYIYTHFGLPRSAHATDLRKPVHLSGQPILVTSLTSGRICRDRLCYYLDYSLNYK